MNIASIQLDITWEDKQSNLSQARSYIARAKRDDCDVVVFPEMFSSGFSMNAQAITEPTNTETSQFLCQQAKEHQINLIAGFVETVEERTENIALCINRDGEIQARYVKNRPYTHAGEDRVYASGDRQVTFDLEDTKASLFICYDLRFPELFRKVAKKVAIIFVIANWPVARQMHWEALLKARAIENQCFLVGVNRLGSDGNRLEYGGGSRVYGPSGEDVSHGHGRQDYIVTQIDPGEVDRIRRSLPFLEDM